MANGELTNILVSTDVTKYLDFKQIAGSFVQQKSGASATVAKVPSTAKEALMSPLMGFFEKRRAQKFLEWVGKFDDRNSTYEGAAPCCAGQGRHADDGGQDSISTAAR